MDGLQNILNKASSTIQGTVKNVIDNTQPTIQHAIDQAQPAIQNALNQAQTASQNAINQAQPTIQNAVNQAQKAFNDAPATFQSVYNAATGASAKLPTRQLGRGGPQVTAVGFGTMGLSAFYGTPKPDAERFAVLDAAYEAGELHWDSADMYQDSEDLLGNWFKANPGKREKIFLATKFANVTKPDGTRSVDSSYEYAKQACDKSLKRLGVSYIDLYYCHRLDGVTPVEKTVQALKELQDAGKIRHIGLSECSADSLRRAYKVAPIAAVQIEYSPFSLDIETPEIGLLKACRELGVAVVCYSPIGRGMITGTIRSPSDFEEGDFRKFAPRFSEENFPKNLELVDHIAKIAQKKGVTSSQLTLAWILAQGPEFIPIPGTTKIDRLHENLGAFKVTLTSDEEKEIRQACEATTIHGGRYPPMFAKSLFADTPPLDSTNEKNTVTPGSAASANNLL